jgi:hypothetical protein
MYSATPPSFCTEACSRSVTTAIESRSSFGFRLMIMRPALIVVLVPSTPMNDDTLSTAGSSRITFCTASCLRPIDWNELVCAASVIAWIMPVSCTGKKPFGTTT